MFYKPGGEEDLFVVRWEMKELGEGEDEQALDLATAKIEERPPDWEGSGFTPSAPVDLPDLTGYHLFGVEWTEEPNEGFRAEIEATIEVPSLGSIVSARTFGNQGREFVEAATAFVGNPTVELLLKIVELEEFPGRTFTGFAQMYLRKPTPPPSTATLAMLI
jgi:hypothetical protein